MSKAGIFACMMCVTFCPRRTGISVCRRLNSAIETVTQTWRSVRLVILVGINSSNLEISSEVAGACITSIVSTVPLKKETKKMTYYIKENLKSIYIQECVCGLHYSFVTDVYSQKTSCSAPYIQVAYIYKLHTWFKNDNRKGISTSGINS